ncbi:MAG: Gfo/Idh/MocA family oxidoreductase [Elusimicrobia bacterium]|nr:Gfo/Idh/MocA family oxidoreductase [Elusimicrobiota bacterium]
MKRTLRVGIAGYGVVGARRRQHIDAHPRLGTGAVSDAKFRKDGALPDGTRCYADYRDLITKEPLDALFVCLPNHLAADATIRGLRRGLHVFCEKPPGRDLADIAAVRAVERRRPALKLKYGFNHRYHDSVRDALALVRSGRLGKVLNLNGVYGKSAIIPFDKGWRAERRFAGGGILLDQGIHMVDLLRLFAGEFTEVHSVVSNSYWRHDVEDNAYALMRTASGVVALLHSSATLWRHRFNLDVTLERGSLTLAGILSGSKSYGAETLTVAVASRDGSGDPRETTTRYNNDPSWRAEVFEFAEAVLKGRPIVHGSSLEALNTMRLIYRIYCADPAWKRRYRLSDTVRR